MTQDELDALPDDSLQFTVETVTLPDGRKERRAVLLSTGGGALWNSDSEPTSVVDSSGQRWMVGWIDGRRVKRRR